MECVVSDDDYDDPQLQQLARYTSENWWASVTRMDTQAADEITAGASANGSAATPDWPLDAETAAALQAGEGGDDYYWGDEHQWNGPSDTDKQPLPSPLPSVSEPADDVWDWEHQDSSSVDEQMFSKRFVEDPDGETVRLEDEKEQDDDANTNETILQQPQLLPKLRYPTLPTGKGWNPIEHNLESEKLRGSIDLIQAISDRDWPEVTKLLKYRLDLNVQNTEGLAPIHAAISVRHPELVRFLMAQDVDLDVTTDDGRSPLHYACAHNDLRLVSCLLAAGVNVHRITKNTGRNALHFAAMWGNMRIVKRLLRRNIDFSCKDKQSRTPADYAHAGGFTEVAELLEACDRRQTRMLEAHMESLREQAWQQAGYQNPQTAYNRFAQGNNSGGGGNWSWSASSGWVRKAAPSQGTILGQPSSYGGRVRFVRFGDEDDGDDGDDDSPVVFVRDDDDSPVVFVRDDDDNNDCYWGDSREDNERYWGDGYQQEDEQEVVCDMCTSPQGSGIPDVYCEICGYVLNDICPECYSTNLDLEDNCHSCYCCLWNPDQPPPEPAKPAKQTEPFYPEDDDDPYGMSIFQ